VIRDVEMQVRSVRASRVSDAPQQLPTSNRLTGFDGNTVALEMSVVNERAVTDG
jgi:hypothetical protein